MGRPLESLTDLPCLVYHTDWYIACTRRYYGGGRKGARTFLIGQFFKRNVPKKGRNPWSIDDDVTMHTQVTFRENSRIPRSPWMVLRDRPLSDGGDR